MDTLPQIPPAPVPPTPPETVVSPASETVAPAPVQKSNIVWFVAIGLAILLIVGAAAAASHGGSKSVSGSTGSAPATVSNADAFRAGVAASGVQYTVSSDDYNVDAGAESICSEGRALSPIDNSDAYYLANQFSTASGLSTMDAARVVGVVMGVYCPDVQVLG